MAEWRLGQITTTVKRQALFLTHSCSSQGKLCIQKTLTSQACTFLSTFNMYISAFILNL
jgi:hypothetical protein